MEIFGVYLVNQSSGSTVPLHQDQENIIGRGIPSPQGEKGRVLLPHPSISKVHAQIMLKPETHEWIIYDKSRHGIYINNKKINKEARLMHGDKIKVGPFELMFYEKFKADDETSEQPLPVYYDRKQESPIFLYIISALLLEMVLAFINAKILLVATLSLLIFSTVLLIKAEWREKARLSYRILFILFFLSIAGISMSVYFLFW